MLSGFVGARFWVAGHVEMSRAESAGERKRIALRRIFHGRFYGRTNFWCKTAQFWATQRECLTTETRSIGNAVQSSENMRNSLGLDYKSAALPAELCRQNAAHTTARRYFEQVANARSVNAS
jgi:hypothetical protein